MRKKLINSQLTNFLTYEMYKRQLLTLAENVFEFSNMPKYIDTAYLNKTLLRQGSTAFFVDEVLGLLSLPYQNIGKLDVYGRPTSIQVISQNGYRDLGGKTYGKRESAPACRGTRGRQEEGHRYRHGPD